MSYCTQAKQTAQHNTPHLSPLLLFERVDRTSMIQSLRPISQSRCYTTVPGIIHICPCIYKAKQRCELNTN